jgi:hypothetical protein
MASLAASYKSLILCLVLKMLSNEHSWGNLLHSPVIQRIGYSLGQNISADYLHSKISLAQCPLLQRTGALRGQLFIA